MGPKTKRGKIVEKAKLYPAKAEGRSKKNVYVQENSNERSRSKGGKKKPQNICTVPPLEGKAWTWQNRGGIRGKGKKTRVFTKKPW